jgi:hypothetical protein
MSRHVVRRVVSSVAVLMVAAFLALLDPLTAARSSAAADPLIVAAGDIACDPGVSWFNGGKGTPTDCQELATASLLAGASAVLPLGDEQYNCGGASAFAQSYDPSWGQQKAISHPVAGNHEYWTSPGTDCSSQPDAAGYYRYFGSAAGDPTKGYYSYDLGAWHIIALNSECGYVATVGGCGSGSPEETWLRNDLAAHSSAPCTLAYWHRPRFAGTSSGGDTSFNQFWVDLYAAHADVVLNGHAHWYERFAQQNPSGQADPNGIREFIVGTGGEESGSTPAQTLPNDQATASGLFGVLKMTLHPGSYDWSFVRSPNSTSTFTDSGSTACHQAGSTADTTPPVTTIACNGSPCSSTPYSGAVSVTLSATDGGSGVSRTRYTTDGTDPTTSGTAVTYTQPFSIGQTATVRYYSLDNAGNQEPAQSRQIQVGTADITAPTTSVSCNTATCSTGWYASPVNAALTATDTGGSGVSQTRYTTDGSDPRTSATAVVYTAPFAVTQTTTISFSSTDTAGNAEAPKSQVVNVDAAAPSVTISKPANGSSYRRGVAIAVTATASDAGTGSGAASGIASISFYRGSVKIGSVTSSPYSVSWNTKGLAFGTYSLTAVATDRAGNATTSSTVNVTLTH